MRIAVENLILKALFIAAVASATSPSFGSEAPAPDDLATWTATISQTPIPYSGCFHAEYPDTVWTEIQCMTNPPDVSFRNSVPAMNRRGTASNSGIGVLAPGRRDTATPELVGNALVNDWGAIGTGLPNGAIVRAQGAFTGTSGITSENNKTSFDSNGNNTYSIQLNSNVFVPSACSGFSNCAAWQQYIYSSSNTSGYSFLVIQFWFLSTNLPHGLPSCPLPTIFLPDGSGNCRFDSTYVPVPQTPISQLSTIGMVANSGAGGLYGSVTLTIGTNAYSVNDPYIDTLDLTNNWNRAEFNIFGDGESSEATFSPSHGSSISVLSSIGDKTITDTCSLIKATGESNNLTVSTSCTTGHLAGFPYVTFTESN